MKNEEVALILRDVFPDLGSATVSTLEHSGEWWKFAVDGRYVFRFPKFANAAQRLRLEYDLLMFLQRKVPVEIPKPQYFCERPGGGPTPICGYERLEGDTLKHAVHEGLTLDEQAAFAGRLGGLLRALNGIPVAEVISIGTMRKSQIRPGSLSSYWRRAASFSRSNCWPPTLPKNPLRILSPESTTTHLLEI